MAEGVSGALRQLGAGVELRRDEQGDLLGDDGQVLDLLGFEQAPAAPVARRGPGRPAGSINRRTAEVASKLTSRFGDPLEAAWQLAMMGVPDMMRLFKIDAETALAEKRLLLLGVLPYAHQRAPLAVALTERKEVHLTVYEGGAPGPTGTTLEHDEIEQFQVVSKDENGAV